MSFESQSHTGWAEPKEELNELDSMTIDARDVAAPILIGKPPLSRPKHNLDGLVPLLFPLLLIFKILFSFQPFLLYPLSYLFISRILVYYLNLLYLPVQSTVLYCTVPCWTVSGSVSKSWVPCLRPSQLESQHTLGRVEQSTHAIDRETLDKVTDYTGSYRVRSRGNEQPRQCMEQTPTKLGPFHGLKARGEHLASLELPGSV